MVTPAHTFTAAQIAPALDKAPRSIRRTLEGVPHSSVEMVNGKEAKLWSLDALPKSLRDELDTRAREQNCRDAAGLLNAPVAAPWQPRLALNDVADECRAKAVKLQRALLPSLERYDTGELSGADLQARGLADYAREFGHSIAERTWRFLFQRTRERARTAADYVRVELFLDDNCARKREMPKALSFDECFGPLHQLIVGFNDPTEPTPKEQEVLWLQACRLFHPRTEDKKFKRALLDFLWHFAPRLATSPEALRVNFGRKYDRWQESEANPTALCDGRRSKLGEERAPAFAQSDLDTLTAYALFNCGARLSQAVRELRELGDQSGLSRDMRKYLGNEFVGTAPTDKSYVPSRLRDAVRHDLAMLKPHRIGARAADAASAWLQRDWSGVPSMFAITMDDLTAPVYFHVRDRNGKVILTRGQVLMAVDCRSWRIQGFSLQPDRNYSSPVIRTLITKVCSERGLPKIFYFEQGIWKSSKLLKGNATGREMRDAGEPFSWPECEHGLLEFGVKFIHAIRPRSKIVERVFGLLQDLMEGEPGYCGRFEREDRPEHLAKKMYAVEHGEDASKWFYSFEQWEERLHALCEKYNATRHGRGTILDGKSPNEVFEECQDASNPPEKFGPDCRYLLAHQKITKIVGNNGVTLQFGKEKFVYRDAQTGALRGQTVLCWFDPDAPEYLVITDTNRLNPISVERAEKVLPFDDESDHFRHEIGKAQAHSSHARARYRVLKVAFREEHRRVVPDRAASELGAQIEQHRAKLDTEKKQIAKTRRMASNVNMALTPRALRRPETPDALKQLGAFLKEPEATEGNEGSAVKTYVLKSPPAVGPSLAQLRARYWSLRNRIQKEVPSAEVFALTRRALGHVKKASDFTAEELTKMISVFSAVIRDREEQKV